MKFAFNPRDVILCISNLPNAKFLQYGGSSGNPDFVNPDPGDSRPGNPKPAWFRQLFTKHSQVTFVSAYNYHYNYYYTQLGTFFCFKEFYFNTK